MKKILPFIYLAFAFSHALAQKPTTGSLKETILSPETDSTIAIPDIMANLNIANNPDSSIYYARQLIAYGRQHHNRRIISEGFNIYSYSFYNKGNYPAALNMAFQSLRAIESGKDARFIGSTYNLIGNIYKGQQNFPKALFYYRRARQLADASHNLLLLNASFLNIAFVYNETGLLDSALYYSKIAAYNSEKNLHGLYLDYILGTMGDVYFKLKNYRKALELYLRAYSIGKKTADFRDASMNAIRLAKYYNQTGKPDSGFYYLYRGLNAAKKASFNKSVFEGTELLARMYEAKHQPDSAFKYLKLASIVKDSLYNAAKSGELENLTTDEFVRQNEIQAAEAAYHARLRIYALIFTLLVFVVAGFLQRRNSLQRKKAFLLLQKQNAEIEAQKAEARVEVALERVRSRTMAMQGSNELAETVSVLFKELLALGIKQEQIRTCGIVTFADNEAMGEQWITETNGEVIPQSFMVPYNEAPAYKAIYKGWKDGEKFMVIHLEGDALAAHLGYLAKTANVPTRDVVLPQQAKEIFNHVMFFSQGCLFIITKEALPGYHDVFKRFGAVFQQSYTRFLDLQKAEEQAREAQIETALERVRSRTMGMQHSDELREVIQLIFQQFKQLNFNIDSANFALDYKESDDFNLWLSSSGQSYPTKVHIPYVDIPIFNRFIEAKKNGVDFLTENYSFEEKNAFFDHFFKNVQGVTDERKEFVMNTAGYARSTVLMKKVTLSMQNYAAIPYSEEENAALRRFGKVFEQTYTRFLDLQQAEAQAREAKIALGLERVRARAMAMQNSVEINDLIGAVFYELTKLDLVVTRCRLWIFDPASLSCMTWQANQETPAYPLGSFIKYNEQPFYQAILKAWKERSLKLVYELKGGEKKSWDEFLFNETEFSRLPEVVKEGMRTPERVLLSASFGNFGAMQTGSPDPLSDKQLEILSRFVKVFDMSYTRFNDLKQAEAQARESQIQLALERVRARTMAMQKSEELAETASVLFQQLLNLGIRSERTIIGIPNDDTRKIEFWGTEQGGNQINTRFEYEADATYAFREIYKAWQEKRSELIVILKGKNLQEHVNYVRNVLHMPLLAELVQEQRMLYNAFFSKGWLEIVTPETQSKETLDILQRFAGVFDGTYTRFLDLQKAETQAREAKIEAALERVRSKTMAMHNSQDVGDTVALMFDELVKLGVEATSRLGIVIIDDTSHMEVWAASADVKGKTSMSIGRLDMTIHPILQALHTAWKNKQAMFTYPLAGEEMKAYFRALNNSPDYPSQFNLDNLPKRQEHNSFIFPEGAIFIFSLQPLATEITQIFKKFAGVFGQTYRRYLDLQKAEAQAREAQIEAALERIRSRSLAMYNTHELNEVIAVVFEKLNELAIATGEMDAVSILIPEDGSKEFTQWIANQVQAYPLGYHLPYVDNPVLSDLWDARASGIDYVAHIYSAEVTKAWFKAAFKYTDYKYFPDAIKNILLNLNSISSCCAFAQHTAIQISGASGTILSKTEAEILKRFARVFDQAYTRFLDLQRAEAQAREAQIEAALEKVRGKAMAMRNSGDLSAAASTVFAELRNLGINPIRSGVGLLSKDNQKAKLYSNTSSATATHLSLMGEIDTSCHPLFEPQYQAWLKQQNYFVALGGKELATYYKILSGALNADLNISVKKSQKEYGHWFVFSEGFLYAWSDKEYTDAEMKILERFKNVIELTFRRYIELQNSEAQARDAVRQASLDRVRAEIASMRSRDDLERITPLIWNELTTLGVPFIRCGVFIMDEPAQLIHTYLSTPDGKAIAAFQLHYNDDTRNGVNATVLRGWRNKQMATLHWTEEEFKNFSHALVEQGEIASEENYLTARPPTSLDLHFFPFLQGMLYAGNTEPLSDDDKDLVQSLADAFSTAYARYEDFNRLELAKQEVERTLTDLKAAQTRLIQSEKMASLGELTAGIAHEIQNPLNFVNNFSEVNQEMIDELEAELNAGNIEEALAIAADIKQNEQKINHHGKRADGIVKGMLQHSRTAGGEKLPTNINAVAEEYMRLSYHGLRAKDKGFNAEMIMHFDPDLPRIRAVGQDIGRVLLNLFNNAFYAVNQKKKTAESGYNPEVSVSTSTEDGQVVIKVKDNGVGMPAQVKDKIMQPFFTTKPTGEGTGLGLSLTYDMVVKGHGGSIKAESIEGEGSEFTILLPVG